MKDRWSRADKISLIGVSIAVVSCGAALLVIPDLRRFLHLDDTTVAEPERKPDVKNENVSDAPTNNSNPVSKSVSGYHSKIAAVTLGDNFSLLKGEVGFSDSSRPARIQFMLRDIATYTNRRSYIKLTACNRSDFGIDLSRLKAWYTPANGDASLNWEFSAQLDVHDGKEIRRPLLRLKPQECQMLGDWNEPSDPQTILSSPLGVLHLSITERGYPDVSIDLARAESAGAIRLRR